MDTRRGFLTILALLVTVGTLRAQTSDTLHSYGSLGVFPITGMLGPQTMTNWDSLPKMLGLNGLCEFWNSPLDPSVVPMETGPADTTLPAPLKDPFYYDTTQNITYTGNPSTSHNYFYLQSYTVWNFLQSAIHGIDVRCYLPGTCPVTQEYGAPWKLALGGNDTIYNPLPPNGTGDPAEWYIPDTAAAPGEYVLRLVNGSPYNSDGSINGSHVSPGATNPYQINLSTPNGGTVGRYDDVGAVTYDFVFYMNNPPSGTTPLYQLEFWSVGNGDSTKLDSVGITGDMYDALPDAYTYVAGRKVGAEDLTYFNQTGHYYKLLRVTLPANVIRGLYDYGKIDTVIDPNNIRDTTFVEHYHQPVIDVRLKTFAVPSVAIYPRLLRIRNWIGQQVLSAKCDSILAAAAHILGAHDHNDAAQCWSSDIESGEPHCLAYVSNWLCDNGHPALTALEGGFPTELAAVSRDQCEAKNASKIQLWIEVDWFQGCGGWRVHANNNFWFGNEDPHQANYAPVPSAVFPDSAEEYRHGLHVLKHDLFDSIWQNYVFGYGSENPGGGIGRDGGFLQYAQMAYGQNPPIPVYVMGQALAGNTMVPKWDMDSIEDIWYNFYVDSEHYSCDIADSLARAKEDSISVATIFQPYFARHPGQQVTMDSIVDPLWWGRFPTTTEMSLQLWAGITHGLKGYGFNILGDDGIRQHGIVDDNLRESQDQTSIHYSTSNDLQTYCGTENNEYCGNNQSLFTNATSWPDTYGVNIAMPPGVKPLFHEAQREMRDDLSPIDSELSKLTWLGIVSWPWRDSTPTYLSKLPVENVTSKNLSGVSDPITYVDLGIHKDPADSLAMYCSVLNRLLWTDSTGTDQTDTRTITMQVRDSAFNPFYINWPTWEITNEATKWDTVVSLGSSFAITLGAGRGALLRIAPSQSITIGKLTTNVWNNARHMAYNETNFDTTHRYWMVYERKGNIYANAPIETPNEGQSKREPDSILGETPIDSCGLAHNPAIAIDPDSGEGFGVVYSIDHAGTTGDSTFIIFRFASTTDDRVYFEKDTLEAFPVSDPYYVAAPAISPHKQWSTWDGVDSLPFWVSWRNPVHGGAIELVGPNHAHSNIRYFSAGDSTDTRFVSLASRVSYVEPLGWPGDTRCYIAFQETEPLVVYPALAEYGSIYYLEAWQDSTNTNQIDTGQLTNISLGAIGCLNRLPCVHVNDAGQVNVTWENMLIHGGIRVWGATKSVILRQKENNFPPQWDDYTSFRVDTINGFYSPMHDTVYTLPQDVTSTAVWVVPWPTPWRDFRRIAWSNPKIDQVTIAHYGITSMLGPISWNRDHLTESAVEPSLSVWETDVDVPEALMFRSALENSDATYDAKITRYDFPIAPVEPDTLLMEAITATTGNNCPVMKATSGGSTPALIAHTGSNTVQITWQPINRFSFDPTHAHPVLNWANPSVRTSTFSAAAGDSLSYNRLFEVGNFELGDTVNAQSGLSGSQDFLRMSINLRRAEDNSIVLVLDTALLTSSGFVSSTSLADSGWGHAVIPITDTFFLTLDMARGDSTDSFVLGHTEDYGDQISDDLPPPDTSTGSSGSPAPKIAPAPSSGASEQPPSLDVSVHPNPVRGIVKICIADLPQGVPATVDVVNAMGVQIAKLYDATPDAELGLCLTMDCRNLPSGTYYADLVTEGQHQAVQFSVQH